MLYLQQTIVHFDINIRICTYMKGETVWMLLAYSRPFVHFDINKRICKTDYGNIRLQLFCLKNYKNLAVLWSCSCFKFRSCF